MKKTVKKRSEEKETLSLELDGKINVVTRKGRKVTREELDGLVCLKVIVRCLEEGLRSMKDG